MSLKNGLDLFSVIFENSLQIFIFSNLLEIPKTKPVTKLVLREIPRSVIVTGARTLIRIQFPLEIALVIHLRISIVDFYNLASWAVMVMPITCPFPFVYLNGYP
jgi:hypothetical protein